ncbi:MAG: cation diffusion facilitator family transporter [Candidatus Neomarinimicrobiota bacterium]|nr:cation diffusion facilitator family transporter [Candidatus Neomarinimicrobiota bacterium]
MNVIFESITNRIIPKSKESTKKYRSRIGKFQGWISIIVNGLMFFLKLLIGLIIGSISVIADAFHTLTDVISSGVVIWGFNESEKPADKNHPYGHGRAEYVATLVIAILLIVAGIEFIESSIERIVNPTIIEPEWWMIISIIITIFIKMIVAQYAEYLSSKIASGTLHADAWHHRADAISSFLVATAMILGKYGYFQVDGWTGLIVALFIMWSGFGIAKEAVDDLIGKPPTIEEINDIRKISLNVEGVIGVHDIAVHSYGKDKFASIHVEIDEQEDQMDAHLISENVEKTLNKKLGVSPTVHVDPISITDPKTKKVKKYLIENYSDHEIISSFHDIRVVDTNKHHVILFGVDVKPNLSKSIVIETCALIEKELQSIFTEFDVDITVSGIHNYS